MSPARPLLVALLMLALLAGAQPGEAWSVNYGPTQPEEAKECLAALGVTFDTAGPTTCLVTWGHLVADSDGALSLRPPLTEFDREHHPRSGDFETVTFLLPPNRVSYALDEEPWISSFEPFEPIAFAPAPWHGRFHFTTEWMEPDVVNAASCVALHFAIVTKDGEGSHILSETTLSGAVGPGPLGLPLPDCADKDRFDTTDGVTTVAPVLPEIDGSVPTDRTLLLEISALLERPGHEHVPATGLRLVHSPDHHSHLAVPLKDSILYRTLNAQWTDERLIATITVEGAFHQEESAWSRTTTELQDAAGRTLGPMHYEPQPFPGMSGHWLPGTVHAVMPLAAGQLPDGDYTIRTTSWNIQHTGRLNGEIPLRIEDDGRTLVIERGDEGSRTYDLAMTMVTESCDCEPAEASPGPDDGRTFDEALQEMPAPSLVWLGLLGAVLVRRLRGTVRRTT